MKNSGESKSYMTKPRKTSCSRTSITKSILTKKQMLPFQRRKITVSYFSQKHNINGQKYFLFDLRWIGLSPAEEEILYLHCVET